MTDANDLPSFRLELESESQDEFRVRLIEAPDDRRKSPRYRSGSPLARTYQGSADSALKELGKALYRSIFVDEIGARFDECRRRLCSAQGDGQVRMRLVLDIQASPDHPDPLFDWPWELLHDGDDWLALDHSLSITRRLNTPWVGAPSGGSIPPPMRVLLAYAEPEPQIKGSVWGEKIFGTISAAIEPVIEPLDLVSVSHVTARMLEEKVKEGFHIIHFLGHGALETEKATMGLIFPELPESQLPDMVTASEFKRWIEDASFRPKLVVLTACHSSSAGGFSNLGLAQALLDAGVEAVVGMQTELWTLEAEKFARAFYKALAEHSRVDDAVHRARQALASSWRDRTGAEEVARVLFLAKSKQEESPRIQYARVPLGDERVKNFFPFPGWAVPTLYLQGDGWLGQGPPEPSITWDADGKEMVFVEDGYFYMDKYPVTRREYRRFADATGRRVPWAEAEPETALERFSKYLPEDTAWKPELVEAQIPATNLTLADALAYAAWAGKHLPTPDEWRRAALSGCSDKEWPYPWGREFSAARCNTRESGHRRPWPVVLSEVYGGCSPTGVCDVVGNVAEWTQTRDGSAFLCGGSYKDSALECSIQTRASIDSPHFTNDGVGFRCAVDLKEKGRK